MLFFSRYFTSKKTFKRKFLELEKKINELETNIKIVKEIAEAKQKIPEYSEMPASTQKEQPPGIKIEHLQVDQIIIEHLDYANNFGQLGIRELSGKLNIGTSYEGDFSKEIKEKVATKLGKAKVNVKAKKE